MSALSLPSSGALNKNSRSRRNDSAAILCGWTLALLIRPNACHSCFLVTPFSRQRSTVLSLPSSLNEKKTLTTATVVRSMASSNSNKNSNSKTGGRLLETAEEYSTLVMDNNSNNSEEDATMTALTTTAENAARPRRPVLVFWTAPWCGPCRLSIPVVKDVIKLYAGRIDALEVCTDDLPEVAADAGVLSIPTIHIYHRGKLLDTLVGCVAKQVLAGSVEKVLEDIAMNKPKGSGIPTNNVLEDMAP